MRFQLVAEPLHGVRSPLHVLLRPGLRASRGPARRRPLRDLHPREDQRRRSPSTRAGPSVLEARTGDDRRCDRSLPAGRGTLSPHPRLPRGAGRSQEPVRHHHAWTDDRSRHRRPRRGRAARERLGHPLDPDARRGRLAQDGALDGPPAAAPPGRLDARRRPGSRPVSGWRQSCRDSPTSHPSLPKS